MKTFDIEILERLNHVVSVQADSLSEAIEKVETEYETGDIILDGNDFVDVTFNNVTE